MYILICPSQPCFRKDLYNIKNVGWDTSREGECKLEFENEINMAKREKDNKMVVLSICLSFSVNLYCETCVTVHHHFVVH